MKKQVSTYFLKALYTRYKRIAENATCEPSDTRTTNALRLAKSDLRKLDRIINEQHR